MTNPEKKAFDCLAFKDQVQAEIYEAIKDLPPDEVLAYFQRRVAESRLADFWNRIPTRFGESRRIA